MSFSARARCALVAWMLVAGRASADESGAQTPAQLLTSAADEILRQVVAVRGLSSRSKVQRGVLSRAQIGEKLRARVDEEYTVAEVSAETRVLGRLGLVPVGLDYKRLLIDLLMEQVAGFYDPKLKRLYIADWLPMDMQRPAIAHELEHALQDQHFNLLALTKPLKDDGDRQLAHAALVEGDGTAVMLELQAQSMRLPVEQLPDLVAQLGEQLLHGAPGQTPIFDGAPTYVRDTLIFPYLEGLRFVMALRRGKPWSRIDAVFKQPPSSTEQILHPDHYVSHDEPVAIDAAPIVALAPRKEIRRDVMGELALRLLFRTRLPEPQADAAAAGWGGDRLVAYAADEKSLPVVMDRSTWDTELDANEAYDAFVALFGKITGSKAVTTETTARYVDANGEVWRAERRGSDVVVLMGAPPLDEQIVAEAWTALHAHAAK
ncbi:MAG: hypothetical protein ABI321_11985 [Polyangia bacterium]